MRSGRPGPLVYTNAKRVATAKVNYKPKTDASGHLIAHSFGGPSKLTENYVAKNKVIKSAGGNRGVIEGYIRTRLKQGGYRRLDGRVPGVHGQRAAANEDQRPLRFNKSPNVVWFSVERP